MSNRRARTGLKRPRETEKALREPVWRENVTAAEARTPQDKWTTLHGGEPPSEYPDVAGLNEVARTMHALAQLFPEGAFGQAFADMQRLGLDGNDLGRKIKARTYEAREAMFATFVAPVIEDLIAQGCSEERALEFVASEGGVGSASVDGAVQRVKRAWLAHKARRS